MKNIKKLAVLRNNHPELFPPSVLSIAFHVAPPVAVLRLMDKKLALTVPLDLDSVWLAAVALPIVTRFPGIPLTLQFVTVVVVAAVNVNVVGCTLLASVVNVLLPVMVSAPAPSFDSVQL